MWIAVRQPGVLRLVLVAFLVAAAVWTVATSPMRVTDISWIWIGGETGINNVGTYGTLNVTSARSVPGGRYGSAAWVGSSGLVYLFGGSGYKDSPSGFLDDLWCLNTSSMEWTWIGGSSTVNQPGVYGTFREGSPTNIPHARANMAFWGTDSDHFWLFGGEGGADAGTYTDLNDLWLYETASGNWIWVAGNDTANVAAVYGPKGIYGPSYSPGARDSAGFWTGSDGLLWLFGGVNRLTGNLFSDLWSFNTSSLEWAYIGGPTKPNQPGSYSAPGVPDASNIPGGRFGPSSWTDSEGNLWMFGGSGYGNSVENVGSLNDLWVYNMSSSVWVFVVGSDTPVISGVYGTFGELSPANDPGGRFYAMSFVDAIGNLQLFGGTPYLSRPPFGSSGFLNDLWVFDLRLRQWAWINGSTQLNAIADYGTFNISSPNVVPGSRYGSMLWKIPGNDPILFGGYGYSNSSTTEPGYLNDVFALTELLPTLIPTSTAMPTPTPTATPTSTPTPTPEPEPVVTGGSAVCFPADASVLVDDQNRVVPMSQIRPGMQVMGADQHGRLVPDTVLSWLHYEPSAVGEVLVIATASGKRLRLTRHHLVYRLDPHRHRRRQQQQQKEQHQQNVHHKNQAWQGHKSEIDLESAFEAVYAERVRVGDALYDAVSRSLDRVVSVESAQTLHGLYAPLTRTGRLVVDGLLVSCYGTYPSHAVSHAVLWPARFATLRGRWASWLGVQHTQGIMPYAAHLYAWWTSIDRITEGLKAGMIAAAC